MSIHEQQILDVVARARARWRRQRVSQAVIRAALAGSAVVAAAIAAARLAGHSPLALMLVGVTALVTGLAAALWGLEPLRHVPSDARVARFVEERAPELDDRLATAVDVIAARRDVPPVLVEPMLADAAARAQAVDLDRVVPSDVLRRVTAQAVAAVGVLTVLLIIGRAPARSAWDATTLMLFPAHVSLQVAPGNARVVSGDPLAIEAALVGNRAPVVPEVQIAEAGGWRRASMRSAAGRFRLALPSVTSSFKYRVAAGSVVSPTFAVNVVQAPRVARIDVEYTYPAGLGLPRRVEEDAGDIYAPAGTDVRVRVHTDRPAARGAMKLADGRAIDLTAEGPTVLSGALKVVDDGSYRVALSDRDGLASQGDTEYFIRMLEDRPPEVHITRPASDRSVTRLAEVDIEAQADDDYGIAAMDLVYSVRGGPEKTLPFAVPARTASVTGQRTVYLEDLGVAPGDFVSYYVRARDLTRGKRPNEARSDIFFLEVRPFEQEFALAQSQSMAGSGYSGSIDDLVNAQKQVVVATWKLDRRSKAASGARSNDDIHSVSRSEAELKTRVEATSSGFRTSTMRDPRRRPAGEPPGTPHAGEALPEEDLMGAAADAMGKAVTSLDRLSTSTALPPELEALNRLLKAQAQVKERQVARQQSGAGGPGSNNRNYDVSTLFDKELQRQQKTNYENPTSAADRQPSGSDNLDKIKDLARRQDELLKRQDDLARNQKGMSAEELKRQLEKLTREQSELRERAEELARQMSGQQGEQTQAGQEGRAGQAGQEGQAGQGQQAGQARQAETSGQAGQRGERDASRRAGDRLREASEQMRNATSGLRRQDAKEASSSGARALERLKDLERQMEQSRPDEKRRALGEMQLESRQLADAERDVASELSKVGSGATADDALRRLAGRQQRLAERTRRLQQGLQQAAGAAGNDPESKEARATASAAERDLKQGQTVERMQQSAEQLRARSEGQPSGRPAGQGERSADLERQAAAHEQMAKSLDQAADKLAGATGGRDGASQKLSEQMARAQQLRDRLNDVGQQLRKLGDSNTPDARSPGGASGRSAARAPGNTGRAGRGEQGGGGGAGTGLERLREEYAKRLRETEQLMNEMRREDPSFARGGEGFTFEGQGMTLSAPGTEAFKQDFARWDALRRQATRALEDVESSISKRLQDALARDRLAAGVDDQAPVAYRQQVDSYFKALATKKKP